MTPETHPVPISDRAGTTSNGTLEVWDERPDGEEGVQLRLMHGDSGWIAHADNFFTALIELRKQFEAEGVRILIYGASKDVYPSPMSRSMGSRPCPGHVIQLTSKA